MGHVDVNAVSYALPDGRPLLDEISFRVGGGATAALVGPNGTGKTTLLRIVAGDLDAHGGTVTSSGGVGVMRQFIGHGRRKARHGVAGYDDVGGLLLSVAPPRIRTAASALEASELAMMEPEDEPTQLRYAQALADWADAGGYEIEVVWDVCTTAALGVEYRAAATARSTR